MGSRKTLLANLDGRRIHTRSGTLRQGDTWGTHQLFYPTPQLDNHLLLTLTSLSEGG